MDQLSKLDSSHIGELDGDAVPLARYPICQRLSSSDDSRRWTALGDLPYHLAKR